MRSHLSKARWTKEILIRAIEPCIKYIHPKYYKKSNKSCNFLFLSRFDRHFWVVLNISAVLLKYCTFGGGFFIPSCAK